MIAFSEAHGLCNSITLLMQEVDAMEPDVTAGRFSGAWHQDKRHGLSIYLRSDSHGSRIEVWRRCRVFLATCSHELRSIEVQEYRPGSWEDEIKQLGHLAFLPTRRPWRQGALH